MDTELARTFLSVVAAGSFVKASERLFVTQSTVSARHDVGVPQGYRLSDDRRAHRDLGKPAPEVHHG